MIGQLSFGYQQTSREAYQEVTPTLGKKQEQVAEMMRHYRDITNTELADALGWSINRVTPRVLELRERGLVVEARKRRCTKTGRNVIAWRVI